MFTGNQDASNPLIGMRLKRLTPDYALEMFANYDLKNPSKTSPEYLAKIAFNDLCHALETNVEALTKEIPEKAKAPSPSPRPSSTSSVRSPAKLGDVSLDI